jgi:hypothetical protein
MPNAIFAFDDQLLGRRAADQLVANGLSADSVQLHANHPEPDEKVSTDVDELVTGGLMSNFANLFQGIFDWSNSPHDPTAYAETLRHGGVVVSVDASTEGECTMADGVMKEAGCVQRTDWGEAASSNQESNTR